MPARLNKLLKDTMELPLSKATVIHQIKNWVINMKIKSISSLYNCIFSLKMKIPTDIAGLAIFLILSISCWVSAQISNQSSSMWVLGSNRKAAEILKGFNVFFWTILWNNCWHLLWWCKGNRWVKLLSQSHDPKLYYYPSTSLQLHIGIKKKAPVLFMNVLEGHLGGSVS